MRAIQVFVYFTLLFFLFAFCCEASHAASYCWGDSWAQRRGRLSCWVRLTLNDGQLLCLSQMQWRRALDGDMPCLDYDVEERRRRSWEPEREGSRSILRIRKGTKGMGSQGRQSVKASWVKGLESLREETSRRLLPHDSTGVLRKLLLNQDCPDCELSLYRMLGFVHLVSPTGIHLYALARLIHSLNFLGLRYFGFSVTAALRLGVASSFLIWFLAWSMTGCKAGMLRPWVVILLRWGGRYLGYEWKGLAPLGLALGVDLAVAVTYHFLGLPGAWAPGRWHYALAVGGGLMALPRYHSTAGWRAGQPFGLKEHVSMSLGSWWTTACWDVWLQGTVATFTPLLSLLTIPLFSLWVYPLALLSVFLLFLGEGRLSSFLMLIIGKLTDVSISLFTHLSVVSQSLWVLSFEALLWGSAGALLALFFCQSFFQRFFLLGLFVFLRLFVFDSIKRPVSVEQLQVGQGDAALVVKDAQSGLVDVASAWSGSMGTWIKRLSIRGHSHLDWIFLTHLDEDHVGGLRRLLPPD